MTDEMILTVCKSAEAALSRLLATYDSGQAVKQGIDTVIAGRPNVGKSTLMNLLSGYEKSIVTAIPGTTRDIVEDTVVAGDVMLRLSDTAGLRDTDDAVEKIGVDRAKQRLEQCGLLLAVFDNSRALEDFDFQLLETAKTVPSLAIINKTDLPSQLDINKIKSYIDNIIFISAATPLSPAPTRSTRARVSSQTNASAPTSAPPCDRSGKQKRRSRRA